MKKVVLFLILIMPKFLMASETLTAREAQARVENAFKYQNPEGRVRAVITFRDPRNRGYFPYTSAEQSESPTASLAGLLLDSAFNSVDRLEQAGIIVSRKFVLWGPTTVRMPILLSRAEFEMIRFFKTSTLDKPVGNTQERLKLRLPNLFMQLSQTGHFKDVEVQFGDLSLTPHKKVREAILHPTLGYRVLSNATDFWDLSMPLSRRTYIDAIHDIESPEGISLIVGCAHLLTP